MQKILWRRRLTAAALTASFVALSGCGSDSTGSASQNTGTLRFSFNGDRSGSFSAMGEFKQSSSTTLPTDRPFAVAIRDQDPDTGERAIALVGVKPTSATKVDLGILVIPEVTQAQDLTVDSQCDASLCPGALLAFELEPNDDTGGANAELYLMETGVIRVTSVSNTHITGTFSGTATDFVSGTKQIQVTGGSFDLPVVDASVSVPTVTRIPAPATALDRLRHR